MLDVEECERPNATGKREKRGMGQGLSLVVTPTGARSWSWFYRFEGVGKSISLGSYPDVSLDAARTKVAALREGIRRGEDPAAHGRMGIRRQAARDRARRFDAVAERWFAVQVKPRREARYADRVWSRVAADLIPPLGEMDIGSIEPGDVVRALRAIEARGSIYSARKIGRWASSIFRFARAEGLTKENPAEGIADALLPVPPAVGQPALAPADVPTFYAAMQRPHGDEEVTRLALELTMHTVLRSSELRGGRWSEIHGAEWHVPAERMKMKRAHVVPLSRQAVALVERLRELTGRGPMMFPGRRPGHTISENTVLFCIYDLGFRGKATGHGWRATFSSWCYSTGRWPSEWIEACLAHQVGTAVSRAYNRQDWREQRREIHQAWSDWLEQQCDVAAAWRARDADLEALLGPPA